MDISTTFNIVADKVHPSMALVFTDDSVSCHIALIVQKCFEECDKKFKVLIWLLDLLNLSPIEHLREGREPQRTHLATWRTDSMFWCTFRGLHILLWHDGDLNKLLGRLF